MIQHQLVLLHLDERKRVPIDPRAIYFLEADGNDTLVRTSGSRRRRDIRTLAILADMVESFGIVRIHRSFAVNVFRIREIRKRDAGDLWEVRMRSPVHRVLPVSEKHAKTLWRAFRES